MRIVKHGEPVLKKPCLPLDYDSIREELPRILRDMWDTMYAAQGVGLAAPQVGLHLRLSVVDVRPEGKAQRLVLINPQIIACEGSMFEEEGFRAIGVAEAAPGLVCDEGVLGRVAPGSPQDQSLRNHSCGIRWSCASSGPEL